MSTSVDLLLKAKELDPEKQITISFNDKKSFRSMKTLLYMARKDLNLEEEIQIKTIKEKTIVLKQQEKISINFSIEDTQEEYTQELPVIRKTKKLLTEEALQQLTSLENEKLQLIEDARTLMSLMTTKEIQDAKADSNSELYALDSELILINKKAKLIRETSNLPFEKELLSEEEKLLSEESLIDK